MLSMTGFGSGTAPFREGRLIGEVRALNHRFTDIRVRTPEELSDHTSFIEQFVRSRLHRGRIDVTVRLDERATHSVDLDPERVRRLFGQLSLLRDELAPGTTLSLDMVLATPALVTRVRGDDSQAVHHALEQGLGEAIEELHRMRGREGELLKQELLGRLSLVSELVATLAKLAPLATVAHQERLQKRLAKLLSTTGHAVSEARLETEIALLAERSDMTEELVRMRSHLGLFEELCKGTAPSGRRLDFLLQEMSRESNTIGAKSQSTELSHVALEMKAHIERLREQVQNVE